MWFINDLATLKGDVILLIDIQILI